MYGKELRRSLRLKSAQWVVDWLPRAPESLGREFCAGLGGAAYFLIRRDRELARGNLARVHPEWSEAQVHREARRVFLELGRNSYDFLRYPGLSPEARDSLVEFADESVLRVPQAAGQGAVLVTGHWGCWEVLAAALVRRGYPFKAMARPLREPRLDRALRGHRERMGFETVSSEGLPRASLRHVKQGGYLGILMDQRIRSGGVMVQFMGQPTRMTEAPVRIAASAQVPLIPFGIRRVSEHRHRVEVGPLVWPGERSVTDLTQELAASLETLIALAPEQWMWIHPRWEERG